MTVTDRWWGSVGVGNPDTAPAHIGVHIDTLRDSIAGYTTALFATVADRTNATSDFLSYHPGAVGMSGFVTGRGGCVYDANTRPGSGGWTWESAETDLVQVAGMTRPSNTGALVDLGSPGTTYVVDHGSFNRRIRLSASAYMENLSTDPISLPAGCQMQIFRNSAEIVEIRLSQLILSATYVAASFSENRSFASWTFTYSGVSTFAVKVRKDGTGTGSVQVRLGSFLVTDLGPAD